MLGQPWDEELQAFPWSWPNSQALCHLQWVREDSGPPPGGREAGRAAFEGVICRYPRVRFHLHRHSGFTYDSAVWRSRWRESGHHGGLCAPPSPRGHPGTCGSCLMSGWGGRGGLATATLSEQSSETWPGGSRGLPRLPSVLSLPICWWPCTRLLTPMPQTLCQ